MSGLSKNNRSDKQTHSSIRSVPSLDSLEAAKIVTLSCLVSHLTSGIGVSVGKDVDVGIGVDVGISFGVAVGTDVGVGVGTGVGVAVG